MSRPPRHRRPLIEALEPRLLFSATADIAVFDDGNSDAQYLAQAAEQVDLASIYSAEPLMLANQTGNPNDGGEPDDVAADISPANASSISSVVFVDTAVDNYAAIVDDIKKNNDANTVTVIYLDPQQNGVEQITSALAQYKNLSAIHIISHGSAGAVALGNATLTDNTLFQYEDDLIAWGKALGDEADILFYGCDVAINPAGQAMIDRIAQLTAADVAASDDVTGHGSLNGDWDLEYRVGAIETPILMSAELQQSFVGVMATTHFINIQNGTNTSQSVTSTVNVGQTFSVDNQGATYTVNQISILLMRSAGAANQDITIQLLDGGWNDASPLASRTISFDKLTTGFSWQTVNFLSDVVLNASQTYIVRVTSSGTDGNVSVAYSNTNQWNDSEMIVSGVNNANADMKLLVSYNNGVNQPSVNTVPGAQVTGQNTPLVFSLANGNRIQISDADAFPNAMEVTLSAGNGSLTLGQTTGLTFSGGDGTNDYFMRIQGSLSDINAALATITYTPATNVVGSDTFTITSKDLGINSVETTSNIAITVYNQLNTVPGAQTVDEDTTLQFSTANGNRLQVTDPGGLGMDTSNVKVTLSVSNGVLTLGSTAGVTFTTGDGTNDATMVFNGTLANINAVLATVNYIPTANYNGSSTLTFTSEASSSGGSLTDSDAIAITVNPVNDAPTVANPIPNQTMTEGNTLNYAFPANTFNDVDGGTLIYSATLSSGTILPAWLAFNATTRTFSGIPDDGDVGTITIRVTATDSDGLSVFDDFTLTVNNLEEAPFVVNPIPNQTAFGFTPFSYQFAHFNEPSPVFVDPDVGGTVVSYRATLADGSPLPGWLSFDSATRTFSGTPTNADAGTITIRLYATDNTGRESPVPDEFNIVTTATANDPPVNSVPGPQSTNEDTPLVFNLANGNRIQIADPDALSSNVRVTLSVTNGVLTLGGTAGLSFTTGDGTNDASMVFTGTVANINNALATLTYTPTANYNGSATLSIVTNDLGNSGTGGAQSDSDTVAITVNAVNDAPVNTVPGAQIGTEDTPLVFSAANGNQIQVNDVDVGGGNLQITLSVTNGTLTLAGTTGLSFTTGDGTNDSSLVFTGTLANINAALSAVTFNPTPDYHGSALLTLTTSDLGNSGSGGALTDTDTVNITLNPTNDAPTVANPLLDQNATEDALFTYTFASNTFNDIDGDILSYSVQVNGGGGLPSWLSFNAATRTFSGTPLNANVGVISIDVTASDGNGGTVVDTFTITVANTNDAPTVATPIPNQSATEDSPFNFQFDSGTFTDQDVGDTLTYSAQLAGGGVLPGWLSFNSATRTFSGTPANGDVGTISIRVTASDGNGGSVSDVFDITVINTNDPPVVATPIADQSATESALFSFTFGVNTFTDPDVGTTLTYTAQLSGGFPLPGWLSFDPATRTFSGTPANGDVGTINVEVTASDGIASVSDTFAIVVGNTDDSPVLVNPIPNQNATEDTFYTYTFPDDTFDDPDVGDTLTYTATLSDDSPLPAWLSFDPLTRTFSGTPVNGDVGTITIKVTAADNDGGPVAIDTFDLTVANTNDAPTVLNPISNQNATEDSPFNFTFDANTFTDQDVGDVLTYSAQQAGGGALPVWLTFDAATRTFSGTPLNAHVGTISIDVIANDGNGGTAIDTFNITVANTNDDPIVANPIPDRTATEDVAFTFQFASNTFSDADVGDTLTYTAYLSGGSSLPAWLSFDAATRTFSGTPTNSDVGVLTINVAANDGHGGTVTDTFTLTVNNVNDAPVVGMTTTDYYVDEQTVLNLHGTGITVADVDSNVITLTIGSAWLGSEITANAGTTGVSILSGNGTPALELSGTLAQLNNFLAGNNGGTLTFNLPSDTPPASVTLTITANDGALTGDDTATIHITAVNDAPVNIVPGAQSTAEDTALVFSAGNGNQIQISDVDAAAGNLEVTLSVTNGTLTLAGTTGLSFTTGDGTADSSLVFRGTLANINAALATLTFNPTANYAGAAVLTITTSDLGNTGAGGTLVDSDNINITITPVNDPPTVASPIPNQNATEDAAFYFQFAAGTFVDVDLNPLAYSATLAGGAPLPGWLTFDPSTRSFSGTPTNDDVGTISITVTANDGNGGTATDTFDIVIANTNDAPTVAIPIPNQTATEATAFNFQFNTGTFADVDVGDTLSYSATLNGAAALPAWLSFDPSTRTFSGVPATTDIGVLTIDVTANDGNGGTVVESFTLTINSLPDTEYIDTGTGGAFVPVSNTNQVGQSFAYDSAGATYTVNEVSLYLARYDAAVPQTITVELRDAWNGAVLGSASIHSSQISRDGFDWHTFNFANVALNDQQSYVIQISSTGNDGLVIVSRMAGNTYPDGAMIENGVPDASGWDLAFKVAKDDGNNGAPVLDNPIANRTINAEAPFNFVVPSNTFSDPDPNDTISYRAQLQGGGSMGWLTFNEATRTFSGTPHWHQAGTMTVELIATDNHGASTSTFFDIDVINTNIPPTVAQPIPNQSVNEDSTLNFQFDINTFADADVGQTFTYSAELAVLGGLPPWLVFDSATRTFSGTPVNADVGTWTVEVTANDGFGGSVTTSFDIVVVNTNDAPTAAYAIPNQTVNEDSPFNFQFDIGTFADEDVGDTLSYSAQIAVAGGMPAWLTFDSATRTFSGTPTNSDVGVVTIEVTATDSAGSSALTTFTITVVNTNDVPTVAIPIPNQSTNEDAPFSFQFDSGTFIDVDAGDTLTYVAQANGGGALPTWLSFDPATRTFSGTPTNDNVGRISIDVIASDANGGSVTATFDVVVVNTNDAPVVANPIPNQNALEDAAFSFQFAANTFADVDTGDVLTYTAQLAGAGGALPAWLSFDPATRTFSGMPTNDNVGRISIDVIANDGNGGTVTATFDIVVVNTNDVPVVANPIPNQNALEDAAFSFQFAANTFADVDAGDVLTYTAQLAGAGGALPAWLSFDPATRTFSGTPTNDDVGTISIAVIANDGNGGTVTETFNIVVVNTNDAPVVANPPANQTAHEDTPFSVTFPANTFFDADVGTTLTYSAQLTSGEPLPVWLVFNPATLSFSGTPAQADVGNLVIEIIASDGIASVAAQFQLNILEVNDAPVALGGAVVNNIEDAAGDQVDLRALFADEETATSDLILSIVSNSNPALVSSASIDPATGILQLRYGANQFGTSELVVRAQDEQGAWVDTLVRVNIEPVNDAPVSSGINDINVQAGAAARQLDLKTVFSDIEDGTALTWTLVENTNAAVTNIQINPLTGLMTLSFSSQAGGDSTVTLRAHDAEGAWVETRFNVTVTQAPVIPPIDPPVVVPPVVTPPIEPPVTPPVVPPVVAPPVTPPVNPPTPEVPITDPSVGGGGGSGEVGITPPGLPDNGQSLIVDTTNGQGSDTTIKDKSSRDIERAEAMFKADSALVTSLTASPALAGLISPDAGFAPWEEADFDSEVRRLRAQMDEAMEEEQDRRAIVAGVTFSITTGLLVWSLRASSLLLTMMSMLPLWRGLDPLPILDEVNKKKKELEQQRKDREKEDKSAKEVGYLFDHAQRKQPKP